MGVDALIDARCLGSLATGQPHDIGSDGHIGTPVVHGSGKEIGLGFHPAPVDSQGFEQFGTEWHFTVTATLALVNADHHALAINVGDLEPAQFGSSHSSG